MKFIVTPTCMAVPRELDGDTLVLRVPADCRGRTATVTPAGEGEAQAFYRGPLGHVARDGRLLPLHRLVEDEEQAAQDEGRAPGPVRALVPGKPGETWDVAIVERLEDAGVGRLLARAAAGVPL